MICLVPSRYPSVRRDFLCRFPAAFPPVPAVRKSLVQGGVPGGVATAAAAAALPLPLRLAATSGPEYSFST